MESEVGLKRINAARTILRNSRFRKMSEEEQNRIYQTMMQKGLSESDLHALLQEYQDEIQAQHSEKNKLENAVEYLMGNFASLPKDVILQLLKDVDLNNIGRFCQLNSEFRDFCTKNNVVEMAAERELRKRTPLSDLNASALNRLDWEKRGQITSYVIRFDNNNQLVDVRMGLTKDSQLERMFSIKGCPAPSGTKVYVLGTFRTIQFGFNAAFDVGLVFLNLREIVLEFEKAARREQVSQIISEIWEDDTVGLPTTENIKEDTFTLFVNQLLANGITNNEYYLFLVTLP